MITRRIFLLPLLAFVAIAAGPAPVAMNIAPPPEVAANPANRWTIQLSSGGTVVILLRPDLAPNHVARIQQLNDEIETVFLMADVSLQPIASRLVKEIARYGGKIDKFVPPAVVADVAAKLGK